ncbi:hypothetical protein AB0392_06005 [Nonomuraea angiospora]|uniref:hypothetical protein n=1 Tax=Nonomuraea angiospora TaxID=46172 RepID=UPI0034510906
MPKRIHSLYAVTPGSIWVDLHRPGRIVLVEALVGRHAVCATLTNSQEVQRLLNLHADGTAYWGTRDMRGAISRIRVDRFRPTSDGFAFVTATGAHLSGLRVGHGASSSAAGKGAA